MTARRKLKVDRSEFTSSVWWCNTLQHSCKITIYTKEYRALHTFLREVLTSTYFTSRNVTLLRITTIDVVGGFCRECLMSLEGGTGKWEMCCPASLKRDQFLKKKRKMMNCPFKRRILILLAKKKKNCKSKKVTIRISTQMHSVIIPSLETQHAWWEFFFLTI